MRRLRWAGSVMLVTSILAGVDAAPTRGQSLAVGDPSETYIRLMQIEGLVDAGSFTVRPLSMATARAASGRVDHPWSGHLHLDPDGQRGSLRWTVGETRLRTFFNSHHPRGQNDGAVWQGKGLTTALDSRASLEWGPLSITVNPLVIHNQNSSFDLAPVLPAGQPEYAYPWWRLDSPQRFGPEAYWTFDLGQSRIALDWRGARVSFGNENLHWGPAIRNAIVMSGNPAGFLHASLGTNRPIDIRIGELEGNWIWGGLGQSDWFDPSVNPDRFITGIVLTYSPKWLGGLAVGVTRVFQERVPEGGLPTREYLLVLQGLLKQSFISEESPGGDDERDQLLSLFARWTFPSSGFEAYFEWSRNDHALNLDDLLLEPEHSQGYTIGFQKVTSFSPQRMIVFRGELTHLEAPPTFQVRTRGVYYTHHIVAQGYTHEGQILGAGIGPGGNAQFLGVDWYAPWGNAGFFVQRQVHDNDAYWIWTAKNGNRFDKHDVSFDVGVNGRYFLGDVELAGGLTYTRELNRYFFGPKVNNFNLALSARWRP